MVKSKSVNIILVIVGFIGIGGFIYWVLTFLKFINLEWMRSVLSILIALILGLIIYFRNKKLKNKK